MINLAVLLISCIQLCYSIDNKIYFENDQPSDRNTQDDSISDGIMKMALNIDQAFTKLNPGQNVLFSPLSIASTMGLLLLGAKGYTALELAQFLGVNSKGRMNMDHRINLLHQQFGNLVSKIVYQTSDGYEIDSATGIFPQITYPVKQEYLNRAKQIYNSDTWPLDYHYRNFDSMAIINKWVANRTHDRITHLLEEPPSPATSVILGNALYFNGNWKHPFIKRATKRVPFYVGQKPGSTLQETVNIDLMVNVAEVPYADDHTRDCQVVGIPYVGEEVFMYIVLPNNDDIEKFTQNLNENDLHSLISSTEKTTVVYAIPKMTLHNGVDLTTVLRGAGLSTTFDQAQADFRNIADGIFIDKVLHKVELEVNEVGTKASAATFGSANKFSMPLVRADRPFLFFIHHKPSDTILFWGKILKPMPNFPSEKNADKGRHSQ